MFIGRRSTQGYQSAKIEKLGYTVPDPFEFEARGKNRSKSIRERKIEEMVNEKLEEDEALSFEEIQAKTNIPAAALAGALASLTVSPKARVLLKEPQGKAVRPGDVFKFNASFVSKTIKIKVSM